MLARVLAARISGENFSIRSTTKRFSTTCLFLVDSEKCFPQSISGRFDAPASVIRTMVTAVEGRELMTMLGVPYSLQLVCQRSTVALINCVVGETPVDFKQEQNGQKDRKWTEVF